MNMTKQDIIDMFYDYTNSNLIATVDFKQMKLDRFNCTVEKLSKCDFSKPFIAYNRDNIISLSIDEVIDCIQSHVINDNYILDYFDFEKVYAKFNNVEISENESDDGFIIHLEDGDSYIGASEISDWIDEHRKEIINYINNTIFSKENLIKILKV